MDILPDFGKYSFYVWMAYGLSTCVLILLAVSTFIQNRKRK